MPELATVLLQLSDIHFRSGRSGSIHDLDADLRAQLEADVCELRRRLGVVHGIIVSGDIGFSGAKDEYVTATITLDPGETKNDEGRTIRLTYETHMLLAACISGKNGSDHVFTRDNGAPVRDFRQTWRQVCVRAGLGKFVCRTCGAILVGTNCEPAGSQTPRAPSTSGCFFTISAAPARATCGASVWMSLRS